MYKIFVPRNISGGWLNMGVQIGPFTISILQLMTLAVGLGIGIGIRNMLVKGGRSKYGAFLPAILLILVFACIAFFKRSELTLFPFLAKMVRTYFLDTTKKFQLNRLRPDPHAINLARSRTVEHDVIIEKKERRLEQEKLDTLKKFTSRKKK